jgi:arylsulfatase/arylsulfatase A
MNKVSLLLPLLPCVAAAQAQAPKPNVIIIMTDDQGYQDLSCYGSPLISTPAIDRMAAEGVRLTDYYVSTSVSSASRAGLLTGRMNTRNGVTGVFFPDAAGMATEEITLAEALREQGYATACFGKWHLGDRPGHLPLDQGFDTYFGVPYSNDMFISPALSFAPDVVLRDGYTRARAEADQTFVRTQKRAEVNKRLKNLSPLMEDNRIVEYPCDQSTLTLRYFNHAISFVRANKQRPFFLYITPNMPHVPIHVSAPFKGKSRGGIYGDAIEEIDWNVGRLLTMLEREGLADNTLIIYTSDNGPWLNQGAQSGHADPLRGGKFSCYEGGVRTPCILRWRGTIPAGMVSHAIVASTDIFPTVMHYAGVDRFAQQIDGINQAPLLEHPDTATPPRNEYTYVYRGIVRGTRQGEWVYLPATGSNKLHPETPELFNLQADIAQKENLHATCREKAEEMEKRYADERN